jgi:uncharacterized protein RhaS with RHS repeats
MHARYYSAGLGRFLSVDPVGGSVGRSQSWNRYSYVLNNPIRALDPNGQDFWDFTNGVANGFGSTMLANAGRQKPVNSDAAIGQAVGDAAGAIVGVVEVFVGTGGDIGGVALTATVAGAPAGVPVVAASTGLIVHGGTAVVTGVGNLTNTLMSSSGGNRSGGGKTGQKQSRDQLARGRENVDRLRSELKDMRSQPNQTPETKALAEKKQRELNRAIDALKASELHAKRSQR